MLELQVAVGSQMVTLLLAWQSWASVVGSAAHIVAVAAAIVEAAAGTVRNPAVAHILGHTAGSSARRSHNSGIVESPAVGYMKGSHCIAALRTHRHIAETVGQG